MIRSPLSRRIHDGNSELQLLSMLNSVRLQSQRRLFRRLYLHSSRRYFRGCAIADRPVFVAHADASHGIHVAKRIQECQSATQLVHGGSWPAPKPSVAEGLSWLRGSERLKLPLRIRTVNVRCQRRLLLDGCAAGGSVCEGGAAAHTANLRSLGVGILGTRGLAFHYAEELSDEDTVSSNEKVSKNSQTYEDFDMSFSLALLCAYLPSGSCLPCQFD